MGWFPCDGSTGLAVGFCATEARGSIANERSNEKITGLRMGASLSHTTEGANAKPGTCGVVRRIRFIDRLLGVRRRSFSEVPRMQRFVMAGCFLLGCMGVAGAQQSYFTSWPEGTSPQEVGKQLAEHFVTSPHQYTATITTRRSARGMGR